MNEQPWQQATKTARLVKALWRLKALANRAGDAAFPLEESWQAQGDHPGRWHHTIVVDRGEAPGIPSSAKTSDEFLAGQR